MQVDHGSEQGASPRGGGLTPVTIQRLEGGLIAMGAMGAVIVVAPGLWWFPLATFLAFDLSMLGYLRSASAGAFWYNAIHTYIWPTALAVVALGTADRWPDLTQWLVLVAAAWAFHVGADRALGYGLKLPDEFTHTHLGRIGKGTTGERP